MLEKDRESGIGLIELLPTSMKWRDRYMKGKKEEEEKEEEEGRRRRKEHSVNVSKIFRFKPISMIFGT